MSLSPVAHIARFLAGTVERAEHLVILADVEIIQIRMDEEDRRSDAARLRDRTCPRIGLRRHQRRFAKSERAAVRGAVAQAFVAPPVVAAILVQMEIAHQSPRAEIVTEIVRPAVHGDDGCGPARLGRRDKRSDPALAGAVDNHPARVCKACRGQAIDRLVDQQAQIAEGIFGRPGKIEREGRANIDEPPRGPDVAGHRTSSGCIGHRPAVSAGPCRIEFHQYRVSPRRLKARRQQEAGGDLPGRCCPVPALQDILHFQCAGRLDLVETRVDTGQFLAAAARLQQHKARCCPLPEGREHRARFTRRRKHPPARPGKVEPPCRWPGRLRTGHPGRNVVARFVLKDDKGHLREDAAREPRHGVGLAGPCMLRVRTIARKPDRRSARKIEALRRRARRQSIRCGVRQDGDSIRFFCDQLGVRRPCAFGEPCRRGVRTEQEPSGRCVREGFAVYDQPVTKQDGPRGSRPPAERRIGNAARIPESPPRCRNGPQVMKVKEEELPGLGRLAAIPSVDGKRAGVRAPGEGAGVDLERGVQRADIPARRVDQPERVPPVKDRMGLPRHRRRRRRRTRALRHFGCEQEPPVRGRRDTRMPARGEDPDLTGRKVKGGQRACGCLARAIARRADGFGRGNARTRPGPAPCLQEVGPGCAATAHF